MNDKPKGHGVGSFLGVHEGPHGISFRHHPSSANLEEGMLVTNEPGFYLPGKFGIRIESLLRIVPKEFDEEDLDGRQYLGFETMTLVPIQKKLIAPHLMTDEQLKWLNDYHRKVERKEKPARSTPVRSSLPCVLQHFPPHCAVSQLAIAGLRCHLCRDVGRLEERLATKSDCPHTKVNVINSGR